MVLLRAFGLAALAAMRVSFLAECFGVGVEGAEHPPQVPIIHAQSLPLFAESARVRRFHWPEAAVTAALIGRADRAAARLRHRAEAGYSFGDHHARRAPPLAFQADAVFRRIGSPVIQQRADDLDKLVLVDRAAA